MDLPEWDSAFAVVFVLVSAVAVGFLFNSRLEKFIDERVNRIFEARELALRRDVASLAQQLALMAVIRTQLEDTRGRMEQQERETDADIESLRQELSEIILKNIEFTKRLAGDVDAIGSKSRAERQAGLDSLEVRLTQITSVRP